MKFYFNSIALTKFKGFIKCVVCKWQFERKYVGKVKSEPTFLCIACEIGKKLSALEDRVSVLEGKANELDSIKDGLKDIKIALIDLQCVSNNSETNSITSTEQLRINLPLAEEKNYADDKLIEKINYWE